MVLYIFHCVFVNLIFIVAIISASQAFGVAGVLFSNLQEHLIIGRMGLVKYLTQVVVSQS